MTSEHTIDPTKQFFEKYDYFGLSPENIVFFEQNTLPTLDFEGRVYLSEKHRISRAPDGNGGLYAAMVNPALDILKVGGPPDVYHLLLNAVGEASFEFHLKPY